MELEKLQQLQGPMTADTCAAAFLIGFTGETRSAYRRDLELWAEWLDFLHVQAFDAQRVHVEAWQRDLEQRFAPSTVARRLASVASFYKYAESNGLIDRHPCAGVRRPRVAENPSTGLSRSELQAILRRSEGSGDRNHALVCLLALNGLRISESLALDIGDMGQERGHRTVQLLRKGRKPQLIPLAPVTAQAVDTMLGPRQPLEDADPLFATRTGNRLDRVTAYRALKAISLKAIGRGISPHVLRHTWVSLALDAGATLRDVQLGAGHADPKTTAGYDRARQSLDRNPTFLVAGLVT